MFKSIHNKRPTHTSWVWKPLYVWLFRSLKSRHSIISQTLHKHWYIYQVTMLITYDIIKNLSFAVMQWGKRLLFDSIGTIIVPMAPDYIFKNINGVLVYALFHSLKSSNRVWDFDMHISWWALNIAMAHKLLNMIDFDSN